MSATQAGRILGLKNSTAKLIVRRYKRSGTMFVKKQKQANKPENSPESN